MDSQLQTMIDNLPEKTGKTLEEWFEVLESKPLEKHGEMLNLLKKEYGVSHGFANTIVTLFRRQGSKEADLVELQYKGKENIYPIYLELIKFIQSLGSDVTITPKKSSVSIIRKRQFLLIKPATRTRIDLGFKLKDEPITDRLENSGPFGKMCTHRVKLSEVSEIDEELKSWITLAYEKSV